MNRLSRDALRVNLVRKTNLNSATKLESIAIFSTSTMEKFNRRQLDLNDFSHLQARFDYITSVEMVTLSMLSI